jgi:hypothetical protein
VIYIAGVIGGIVGSIVFLMVYGTIVSAMYGGQGEIGISLLAPLTLAIIAAGFAGGFLLTIVLFKQS